MSKIFVIAGAGFRGFCDALALNKEGHDVHIIESAPFFGGIAYSREVKGFAVDKGVHVFDSVTKDLADIVNEIMEGQIHTIEFVSASAFNGQITEGFSLPDLSSLNGQIKNKIKSEVLALAASGRNGPKPNNLKEVFFSRFGLTAGQIFSDIFEKVYSIGPEHIEPSGMSVTSLHRLKFLDDPDMLKLKEDPWLDTVLAARRKNMGKIDDLVSIYPSTGEAMRGWCERAAKWLVNKGVKISLGEKITGIKNGGERVVVTTDKQKIEADKVIWSNDNIVALSKALGFETDINDYQHGTPMVFVTMITEADKIKDFTYLQNFEPEGLTYRTAAAGLYSNQIKENGTSFITSECPVKIGSNHWNNPETMVPKVWEECKRLGIVANDATLVDHEAIRIPVTFKPAKVGYSRKIENIYKEIPKRNPHVILRNVEPFFRRDIYLDSLKLRDLVA